MAAEDDPWNAGRQNDDLSQDTHKGHDETTTFKDSNFRISQVDEHLIQMGAWMDTITGVIVWQNFETTIPTETFRIRPKK